MQDREDASLSQWIGVVRAGTLARNMDITNAAISSTSGWPVLGELSARNTETVRADGRTLPRMRVRTRISPVQERVE